MSACRHRPVCPKGTPSWHCAKRTDIEAGVTAGVVTERQAVHLLQLYGLPYSGKSKVFTGERPKPETLW